MLIATQIRVGMTVIYKGEPCKVIFVQHLTPGKGRGMVHAKFKNLKTGATLENRFRSDEKLERAYLEQHEMEYLYNSKSEYFFMNTETYEQISLTNDTISDYIYYLIPNVKFKIDFFEGRPVGIEPPKVVNLKVTETAPYLKGATASSSTKPAKLETGLVVNVPSFVEVGEVVRVDTTEGKYVERA
jgi:elongation factor P